MGAIFGHLNVKDSDRVYNSTVGQQVLYDAARKYIADASNALAASLGIFVDSSTDKHTERFRLPGSGYLQRRGNNGRYGAVKSLGSWDVAYPLEDFGAQIASNDVDMAYMLVGDLEMALQTVLIHNVNTVRYELFKSLLNKTNATYVDQLWGSLTIRRLANTDGTLYPPVVGAEDPAEATNYFGINNATIDATHNPYVNAKNLFESYFGAPSGGIPMVTFIHRDQEATTRSLANFVALPPTIVRVGDDTDTVAGLPNVPGTIIGSADGTWVSIYPWMPTGYTLSVALNAPAPLKKRVDPADTGLGSDLQLVAVDEKFPFQGSFWRNRFGFGVSNRLNGVAQQVVASTTYTTPSAYA